MFRKPVQTNYRVLRHFECSQFELYLTNSVKVCKLKIDHASGGRKKFISSCRKIIDLKFQRMTTYNNRVLKHTLTLQGNFNVCASFLGLIDAWAR